MEDIISYLFLQSNKNYMQIKTIMKEASMNAFKNMSERSTNHMQLISSNLHINRCKRNSSLLCGSKCNIRQNNKCKTVEATTFMVCFVRFLNFFEGVWPLQFPLGIERYVSIVPWTFQTR